MADDATMVAPHVYKLLFKNERARVIEVTMVPGARTAMHSHPDYFVYFFAAGKAKFTTPSGETQEKSSGPRTRRCGGKLRSTQSRILAAPPSARSSSSRSRRLRRAACLAEQAPRRA